MTGLFRRSSAYRLILSGMVVPLLVYGSAIAMVLSHFGGTASLPADCALVFGAAVRPVYSEAGEIIDAAAGPGIRRRVSTAIRLYRNGDVDRLFFSGGIGSDMRKSEALVMKEYALDQGVPESDITLEQQAHSTEENIRFSRPLMQGCDGTIAISDRYHLARIAALAKREHWNIETYPSDYHAALGFELRSVLREAVGIVWYAILR